MGRRTRHPATRTRSTGRLTLCLQALSLRWFEPNTCHHLRKQPVAWAYPGSRAVLVLSRRMSWCAAVSPCIAVVTDIWRTESGQSQRFTEPLVPPVSLVIRPGKGPASPEQDRRVIPVWPTHGPRNLRAVGVLVPDAQASPWTLGWRRAGRAAPHLRCSTGRRVLPVGRTNLLPAGLSAWPVC